MWKSVCPAAVHSSPCLQQGDLDEGCPRVGSRASIKKWQLLLCLKSSQAHRWQESSSAPLPMPCFSVLKCCEPHPWNQPLENVHQDISHPLGCSGFHTVSARGRYFKSLSSKPVDGDLDCMKVNLAHSQQFKNTALS